MDRSRNFRVNSSTFYSRLRMNNLTFSLRPRPSMITLFEPPPNKVGLWKEKWVCVESRMGFPFYPKHKSLLSWSPVKKKTKYSDSDIKFFDYIKSELRTDPKTQTKVFLTSELIDNPSKKFCGIGGLFVDARRRELGLEGNDEYPVWRLHPNRIFSNDCPKCSNPNSPGCPNTKGRNFYYLLVLRLHTTDTNCFVLFTFCRDGRQLRTMS